MLSLVDFSVKQRVGPLSVSAAAGQHIALLGPNGSGKSSLLLGIAGLISSLGQVALEQQDIRQWTMQYAAIKRAMLPQRTAQLLPIACYQVIALGASPLNCSASAIQSAIEQVCLRLELLDYLERDFSQLSGGEQQRILLAKTLLQIWPTLNPQARLLLLDEPLGALDALTRIDMQDLIVSLWQEHGFTVLLVTHDVSEAVQLADRIILLDQGHIKQSFNVDLARPRVKNIAFTRLEQQVLEAVLAT